MPTDYAILISLALTGILDKRLERITGRGLLQRGEEFLGHLLGWLTEQVAIINSGERRRRQL